MITKLIEFNNQDQALLRGILTVPENPQDKSVVMMVGGFERSATTEKKFKALADKLTGEGLATFRFDSSDCGLSDGDFYNMTTDSLATDLQSAISHFQGLDYEKFSVVGHSLGACAISLLVGKINFEKIILLAPALNQKDLLRLWFAQKNNKDKKIDWGNYKDNFKEEDFLNSLKFDLTTKSHKLNFKYRLDNESIDYSQNYKDVNSNLILLIHGNNDDKVPLESLNIDFSNCVIVDKGDHDLEQPGVIEQWLDKAVEFLK